MPPIVNRYATPLVTGLFLVSLVSEVALFFHWGAAWFHGMHEWLSMVLILPFGLHLWKNWRPVVGYLKRAPLWIAMAASVALAGLFVLPVAGSSGGTGGRPPQFAFAERMMALDLDATAQALGVPVATLMQALPAPAGADGATSLAAIAEGAGMTSAQIMSALLSTGP